MVLQKGRGLLHKIKGHFKHKRNPSSPSSINLPPELVQSSGGALIWIARMPLEAGPKGTSSAFRCGCFRMYVRTWGLFDQSSIGAS